MTRNVLLLVLSAMFLVPAAHAESPDEIFSFARHLKRDGMFEAAAQQFLRFVRENPRDTRAPDALSNAADCLAETDNAEQAITVLETITTTYPDHPDRCRFQVQLGRLYYQTERYADADRVFTAVAVTTPDCALVPDALLGKGETLIAMQQYARAADVLRNLSSTYIESKAAPRAAYNLAFCFKKLDREDEALRTYERVVANFPGDPLAGFAALEAARMHVERDETERAIQYYARAKQFGTKVLAVPAGLEGGDVLAAAGDHERAYQWFEELLARPDLDNRPTVHIKTVVAAYDAGKYDAVVRLAADYDARFPGTFSPQIVFTRARAALHSGNHAAAMADASALERFAPGTEWARSAPRVRGEAYLGMGKPIDAVQQFNAFVSVSGDSTTRCTVLRQVADISLTVTRDTTAALDALNRLLEVQQRRDPEEMLTVAGTHERTRRFDQSKRIYDEILRLYPLSDEAEKAQSRVNWLDEFTVTDYAAAARGMDMTAQSIAAGKGSYLTLVDARINVMKDFAGALALCDQLAKAWKDAAQYQEVLYYQGLAHSKLARRALGAEGGSKDRAKDHAKQAAKLWDELAKKHADAPVAARAAFDGVLLSVEVDGVLDARRAEAVLAAYPDRPEGAGVLELLGDQHSGASDKETLTRAASYYGRSLVLVNERAVQLKLATVRSRMGEQEAALNVFEALARNDGSRTGLKASYEAGRTLREMKRYGDAIPHFERVIAADIAGTFGIDASLQAADCLYMQKDYERALERYMRVEQTAASESRRWDASYRMALCYKQTGRFEDALDRMVGCLLQPHGGNARPRVFESAAEVAERLGDTGAQVTVLEAYVGEVASGEGVTKASKQLARLYLQRGEADKAYDIAQRLSRSVPGEDVEPRALMAMARYRQGKAGDARKLRDEVAKSAGADAAIVREIGVEEAQFHYDQKRFADAANSIRPFAENCSGDGVCEQARYLYAMSLFGANQLDQGTSVAQRFFRDYPVTRLGPMLHLRMGNVLAAANRTSESLLHYEEAAETTTDTTIAHMALKNLGVAYQKLTRWRDAEKAWQRVLVRFPESSYAGEAALNLARCKMEYGDYRGAIESYQSAMPMLDGEAKARAFYWMGTSYEQLGDYQSAVVEYLKVPYLSQGGGMWIVTAQLKAAECYTKINRNDAASEIYTKVINNHGANSNWGKLARKGLDSIAAAGSGGGER